MNVLFFIVLTCLPQCPQSYSDLRQFDTTSQVIYPKNHNYIHYSGKIYSKKYVVAVWEDGREILVPVINGLLPSVKCEFLPNGGIRKDFWYDKKIKYDEQKEIKYYKKDTSLPKEEVFKKEESDLDDIKVQSFPLKKIEMPDPKLEEIIGNIEKALKETEYEIPSLNSLMFMKKPSEFDKESK